MDGRINLGEINRKNRELDKIYTNVKIAFHKLITAIDAGDIEISNKYKQELTSAIDKCGFALEDPSDTLTVSRYKYITDVIKNYIYLANLVDEVSKKDINQLVNDTLLSIGKPLYFIYKRYYYKKYDGPLDFTSNMKNIDDLIQERNELLNTGGFIGKLEVMATKEMTRTDDLPDYYDIYKITSEPTFDDFIDVKSIGKLINICSNLSNDNIGITNKFFKCRKDNKTFRISYTKNPFRITISCGTGKDIVICLNREYSMESDEDDSELHPVYISKLSLYYTFNKDDYLKCETIEENKYGYIDDFTECSNGFKNLYNSNGKVIDWKYFALHNPDFISKDDLEFVISELKSFIDGITNSDLDERIKSLQKIVDRRVF